MTLIGCSSDQSKAEKAISTFLKKFSLNPEAYEPVEFLDLKETERGYELDHMYRIVTQEGKKEMKTHTFKLTKDMNVFIDPFERFD